jgi:hypothetical protein
LRSSGFKYRHVTVGTLTVLMVLQIFSDVQSDVYGGGKIWLYHILPQLARRTSPEKTLMAGAAFEVANGCR